ncbi:MAG: hypothetical protein MSC45_00085 [Mobiluncus sp.]|uniref:hypothetical protein n=1 Tax=Mobiluncus sp. TaxID=47293 RepID=UPI00258D6406|nr:hypothetical protein [Mobiluncus sp.]MCI6583453.1 hypothetical protein [Mobiluncus sp.]
MATRKNPKPAARRPRQAAQKPGAGNVFTLDSLDVEASVEPVVFRTPSGVEVVFPDPYDLEPEDAQRFYEMSKAAQEGGRVSFEEIFSTWVGKDGWAALCADHITVRQMNALLDAVNDYYGMILGNAGESRA